MTYITTLMGILRAGFTGFPISSRNSPAALAHLLAKTNVKALFVSPDDPTQNLVHAGLETLQATSQQGAASGVYKPYVASIPMHGELYPADEIEPFVYLPDMKDVNIDAKAVILHSSGSTAFPKPIPYTHRNLLENARGPCKFFSKANSST